MHLTVPVALPWECLSVTWVNVVFLLHFNFTEKFPPSDLASCLSAPESRFQEAGFAFWKLFLSSCKAHRRVYFMIQFQTVYLRMRSGESRRPYLPMAIGLWFVSNGLQQMFTDVVYCHS